MRSYDPKLERFLQPDPSQQEGLFSYAYVGDDPVDFTDPSGLDACGTISSFFSFGGGFINTVCTSAVAFGRSVVQGLGSLLGGTYTLVAGSDISALTNPNASGGEKFVAIVDLASNALLLVPGVDAADAARLAFKGATKLEEHELTFDEAKALVRRVVGCGCFPGNTGVRTPKGLVAIASLKLGDLVLAEDPSSHKVEPEPVLAVIDDGIKPLMQVRMSDGSSLSVTTNHPFYVDSGPGITTPQWVQAGDLRVGDRLRTEDGHDVTITVLRYDTGYARVYTLTVAHDHTFFVGNGEPVLVHNAECFIYQSGQDFEHTLETPVGQVGILAETEIQGDTVILKHGAIYPVGAEKVAGGMQSAMVYRSLIQALARSAEAQGLKYVKLEGIRVPDSSSANPGHIVDLLIDAATGRIIR